MTLRKSHTRVMSSENGFTLIELLVGAAMAGILAAAGLSLSTHIHRSSKDDVSSMRGIGRTDSVLDMLNEEINLSKKIITVESDLPQGCTSGGGTFFLAFQLPPQAYGKGDYSTITNSKGQVTTKAQSHNSLCPTVIGLKPSTPEETGPFSLYRYGPQIDSKGFYIDTTKMPMNSVTLLDGISSQPKGLRKSCTTHWNYKNTSGLEACIDKYKKSALLSVSRTPVKDGRTIKRSSASSSKVLDESLVPPMYKGATGGVGGTTNMAGQGNLPCDGTTFLIDVSGSMGGIKRVFRYGRWMHIWDPYGGRMAKAKSELLSAIKGCPNGARINVHAFHHGSTPFRRTIFALDPNTRNSLNSWIGTMRAWGGTNPWPSMDQLMQDRSTKRIVALTDGGTRRTGTCFHNRQYMNYADCYAQYNNTVRQGDPVEVRGIVVDADCDRGYASWMGELSRKTGGKCVRANL